MLIIIRLVWVTKLGGFSALGDFHQDSPVWVEPFAGAFPNPTWVVGHSLARLQPGSRLNGRRGEAGRGEGSCSTPALADDGRKTLTPGETNVCLGGGYRPRLPMNSSRFLVFGPCQPHEGHRARALRENSGRNAGAGHEWQSGAPTRQSDRPTLLRSLRRDRLKAGLVKTIDAINPA